jgi:hypothetical protein
VQGENNVVSTAYDFIYTQWNVGNLAIPWTWDMTKAAAIERIHELYIYQNGEGNGEGDAQRLNGDAIEWGMLE